MRDIDIMPKFSKYLDYSKDSEEKPIATTEMRLIENAKIEAIEAYEEYKKREEERVKSGEIED
jgi:hypothetical protein